MTKAKDELTKQLREELAELATSLQGDSYYSVLPDELGDEHIKPFLDIITAHTNAEIARTLDRLESEVQGIATSKPTVDYATSIPTNKVLYTIQAERAKLKEVK